MTALLRTRKEKIENGGAKYEWEKVEPDEGKRLVDGVEVRDDGEGRGEGWHVVEVEVGSLEEYAKV